MYLSRELTDQTLPAIGRAFGGRNHTTVLHAYKRTAERIAGDPAAFDVVRRLTESWAPPTSAHDAARAARLSRSCAQAPHTHFPASCGLSRGCAHHRQPL